MKKNYISKAAALLAFSLVLGGCGSGSGGSSKSAMQSYAVAETTAAAYPMAAAPAGAMEGYFDGGMNYEEFGIYEEDTALASVTDTSSISQPPLANRKLIRNVSMDVETDAFDRLLEDIQKKVTELSGYTEQSDISGNRSQYQSRYAWLTVRIPCDKLDQFIDIVENTGNVTRKSESVQDITLQYSDLESRKKTLTMEQERIWALLEKADTLEAVIALEERLSEIRYELESMESQLKLFDNQVDYSRVDISVNEVLPANFTPTAPETVGERIKKGLSRNMDNMGEFVTDLFVGLIIFIPVWIPFGVIAALFILLLNRFRKKHRKADKTGGQRPWSIRLPEKAGSGKTASDEDQTTSTTPPQDS